MSNVSQRDVVVTTWMENGTNANLSQAAITLTQSTGTNMGEAAMTGPWIKAVGTMTVRGTPGESVGFWRFGFIQLKFITDDWAHYRGETQAKGSVFFAIDRPPARAQQLCRDTYTIGQGNDFPVLGPIIFYDGDQQMISTTVGRVAGFLAADAKIPATGSIIVNVLFSDSPSRAYDLIQLNEKFIPAQRNYLYSLQTGAAFCTMFALQKGPGQPIEVLKTFQWNVRWRAHFRTTGGVVQQAPPKAGDVLDMNVSQVFDGPPIDPRFRQFATDKTLPVCNDLMQKAYANPVRKTSTRWEDWKVGH